MASKTRIVVTNKIEHLKRADKILLLHNGECFFYGTFSELQSQRPDFSSLLLGLEAYDNFTAERRGSILTETLRRVSVDETSGIRPDRPSYRQVAPPTYKDERKASVIINPLTADRKASFIQVIEEETKRPLPERKFSLVPENQLVDELFMEKDMYHNHGVHMAGQRRQSVLAFMTNSQSLCRRDQLQSSFHSRLSIVPQSELASELDIYTRRLSKDSAYNITGEMDEENIVVRNIRHDVHCFTGLLLIASIGDYSSAQGSDAPAVIKEKRINIKMEIKIANWKSFHCLDKRFSQHIKITSLMERA